MPYSQFTENTFFHYTVLSFNIFFYVNMLDIFNHHVASLLCNVVFQNSIQIVAHSSLSPGRNLSKLCLSQGRDLKRVESQSKPGPEEVLNDSDNVNILFFVVSEAWFYISVT